MSSDKKVRFIEVVKEIPVGIRFLKSDPQKCSRSCLFFHEKHFEHRTSGSKDVPGSLHFWSKISCQLFHSSLSEKSIDFICDIDENEKKLEESSQRLKKCIELFGE